MRDQTLYCCFLCSLISHFSALTDFCAVWRCEFNMHNQKIIGLWTISSVKIYRVALVFFNHSASHCFECALTVLFSVDSKTVWWRRGRLCCSRSACWKRKLRNWRRVHTTPVPHRASSAPYRTQRAVTGKKYWIKQTNKADRKQLTVVWILTIDVTPTQQHQISLLKHFFCEFHPFLYYHAAGYCTCTVYSPW